MSEAKGLLPDVESAWVVKCQRNWKTARWSPAIRELIDDAKTAGLDALDLGANRPLNRGNVDDIKSAGLGVYIWTVDSPSKAQQLIDAGVDGITTNRPGWLRQQLQM
jgi:glycerophosphoryl diester phosphodiesterase